MEDWKINLIESSNSTIFDDKISEIDDESSQESE